MFSTQPGYIRHEFCPIRACWGIESLGAVKHKERKIKYKLGQIIAMEREEIFKNQTKAICKVCNSHILNDAPFSHITIFPLCYLLIQ